MSNVFGHGRLRLYLLKLLDESPRHGYDIIRELEDRFMGLYSPSAGTVYPRLARLEAEGLVEHSEADGRKVFSITDAGRTELHARQDELTDIEADIAGSVRDLAAEIRSEVRGSVKELRAELKSAARDVRREARHHARTARDNRHARHPVAVEIEQLAETLRLEVSHLVRQRSAAALDLEAAKTIVDTATIEIRRLLKDVTTRR